MPFLNPIEKDEACFSNLFDITGSLPLASLPVDSAISCSIQSQRPGSLVSSLTKFTTCFELEKSAAAIKTAGELALASI